MSCLCYAHTLFLIWMVRRAAANYEAGADPAINGRTIVRLLASAKPISGGNKKHARHIQRRPLHRFFELDKDLSGYISVDEDDQNKDRFISA